MSYLFVTGISIALFLTLILLTKRGKSKTDFIFSGLLFFSAQTIFNTFLVETRIYEDYPDLLVLGFSSPIVVSVFLYLYTKYLTTDMPFKWNELWHFAPAAIIFLLYSRFFFLNHAEKEATMQSGGSAYEPLNLIRIVLIYLTGIVYNIFSLRILYKYRRNIKNKFSNTDRIEFNWLMFLIISMLLIWLVVIFIQEDRIISISATIFVVLLGYFGITQVSVFNRGATRVANDIMQVELIKHEEKLDPSSPKSKYQYSNLGLDESLQIHEQLLKILENDKPFLNPELTLADLAKMVPTHPNKLSEVINKHENKNFYDLVNGKRIQEFFRLLNLPESQQYTIMSLAYDCGFNSKASFNRNFKRITGQTPSEYLNNKN